MQKTRSMDDESERVLFEASVAIVTQFTMLRTYLEVLKCNIPKDYAIMS